MREQYRCPDAPEPKVCLGCGFRKERVHTDEHRTALAGVHNIAGTHTHVMGGLMPQHRITSALGKSKLSAYCDPGPKVRLQSINRGQRHCAQPAAPLLGVPNTLANRLYTRLQPRLVPSRIATPSGPSFSLYSVSFWAMVSSASSQEIRSKCPSPRAPTRFMG